MRFSFAIVFFAFLALFCGVALPVRAADIDRLPSISRLHALHQTTTTKAPTTGTTSTTTTTKTTTTLPPFVTDSIPTKAYARNCMCHENAPTPLGDYLEVKDSKYFKYASGVQIRFSNPFPEQQWTCRQGGDDTWVGRSTAETSHTTKNDCAGVNHRLCSTIARWVPSTSCIDQTSKYVMASAAGVTNPSFVVTCPGTLYFGIWDSDSVCSTNSNNSIYFQTHLTYRK